MTEEEIQVPAVGTKFKRPGKKGTLSFLRAEENNEGKKWWTLVDIETGKYHSYYPHELIEAGKIQKRNTKKPKSSLLDIEEDRKPILVTFKNGEWINVL